MGTILGASPGFAEEEQAVPEPGDATVSWEEGPELVGVAFNLSKQLNTELDRVRHELEEDTHPSKSEIAEVALRIAVEDFRSRGRESELARGSKNATRPGPRQERLRRHPSQRRAQRGPERPDLRDHLRPERRGPR